MAGHSFILIVIEPRMGFQGLADFFDLAKVIPALSSMAWYASNVLHVMSGIGLLFLRAGIASGGDAWKTLAGSLALAAAPLFVVVGFSGFVLEWLPGLLSDPSAVDAALYGLLATRLTVLVAAIALFGFLIGAISLQRNFAAGWLRVIGVPVCVAGLAFVFVPTPIPVLLCIWSTGLAVDVRRRISLASESWSG